KELQLLDDHAARIISEIEKPGNREVPLDAPYAFYVFDNYRLTSWNDHLFVPRVSAMAENFTLRLLRDGNSDYLARKWAIDNKTFLVGVLPLYRRYQITNHYLEPRQNEDVFGGERISIHEPGSVEGIPVCISNSCPCRITFVAGSAVADLPSALAVVFILLAVMVLLVLCFELLQRYLYRGLVVVIFRGVLLLTRFIMTALEFPRAYIDWNLFDPLQFA